VVVQGELQESLMLQDATGDIRVKNTTDTLLRNASVPPKNVVSLAPDGTLQSYVQMQVI
jgi:hypothetical protein